MVARVRACRAADGRPFAFASGFRTSSADRRSASIKLVTFAGSFRTSGSSTSSPSALALMIDVLPGERHLPLVGLWLLPLRLQLADLVAIVEEGKLVAVGTKEGVLLAEAHHEGHHGSALRLLHRPEEDLVGPLHPLSRVRPSRTARGRPDPPDPGPRSGRRRWPARWRARRCRSRPRPGLRNGHPRCSPSPPASDRPRYPPPCTRACTECGSDPFCGADRSPDSSSPEEALPKA
jgi:hypothetical protein